MPFVPPGRRSVGIGVGMNCVVVWYYGWVHLGAAEVYSPYNLDV